MKPKVRCYYWGEANALVNLGDLLVPLLLDAIGFQAVPRTAPDSAVINPGRCLLVIGSLLTQRDVDHIGYPLDVWGCGWKGSKSCPSDSNDLRFFAVRGPQTAAGLSLAANIALGDPALLLPKLLPLAHKQHGKAVLMPHFSRLSLMPAAQRRHLSGCDEVISPMVLRRPWAQILSTLSPVLLARLLERRWRHGITTHDVWHTLRRLAGARFVLTGSLHGAILAQAFGVPWACYDDGYLDAPAKWNDWAAYLNIDIEVVSTLAQGEYWWQRCGHRGKLRDLDALLAAFPYA